MKKLLKLFCLAAAIIAAGSCRHESDSAEYPDNNIVVEYDTSNKIDQPVCFFGYNEQWLCDAIAQRASSITGDPDQAGVIVCSSSDLKSRESEVTALLDRGGVVMEVNPDIEAHSEWFRSHGYLSAVSNDGRDILAIASASNATFALTDIPDESVLSSMQIESEELTGSEVTVGSEGGQRYSDTYITDVEKAETAEYGRIHINSLVDWIDDKLETRNLLTENDKDIHTELADDIAAKKYGYNLHEQFQVEFKNFEIAHIILSDPDTKTCKSTIDMDIDVIPIYAYNATNDPDAAGDYYYIKCTMVSHNGSLFSTVSQYHWGVETYYHAFYMRDFRYRFSLLGADDNTVVFEHYPVPETTQGSVSYTSGFSSSLNVSGNVGYTAAKLGGGITVGGTWTWSDSQTRNMSDYRIELITDSNAKSILWSNHIQNLDEDDDVNKAVPAIARSDWRMESSWCWHVKGLEDGEKKAFSLCVDMLPYFGYTYRHTTWAAEGHICQTNGEVVWPRVSFAMTPPDRAEYGIVNIMNTDSKRYMYQVEFYDEMWNQVYVDKTAVPQNESLNVQLPKGKYYVFFNKTDGDTGDSSRWVFKNQVEVNTGLTGKYSTLDATEVN